MNTLFEGTWIYRDRDGRCIEVILSLDKDGCDRIAGVLGRRAMKQRKGKATAARGALVARVRVLPK